MERLYRVPDRMGNLFETRERDDRRYDASGQLAEDREYFYHYDCEGNSIISDYLGTPLQAYDKQGNKVWEQELDIYGRQRKRPFAFIPFKYQGQYEDAETGLYYNRFRYYDPNAGSYISQDPIGLAGGNPTLYACVKDSNNEIDVYGLNVFWSGGVDAQNTARIFAKQKGDTILEMPPHGQALEEWKSSRLFPLSYLFQKNQYKCDIVPSLPTGLCGIEPVEHAPV